MFVIKYYLSQDNVVLRRVMRVIGQTEAFMYKREGFNENMINNGPSVDMNEIYDYMKRTQKKSAGELSREEFLMFRIKP